MNRRLLGNVLIFILIILLGSGIAMYLIPFSKGLASLHTVFGFLFVLAMVFHIINNKKPLFNYITGSKRSSFQKLQAPFIFSFLVAIGIGLFLNVPILNSIYNFGNQLKNQKLGKDETSFDYEVIELSNVNGQHHFEVELKKGSAFKYPLFAIWLEDSLGNYIETLYISRVIASSTFDFGKNVNGKWQSAIKRRPEALPYWSHKRGIKASDGLYIPLNNAKDLDAVSGATPTGNFIIKSRSNISTLNGYKVMLEVNQSYDWNTFYTKDKFPDDEIYSGSGQVGQPSLIYTADVSSKDIKDNNYKIMKLIGHGHHSGKNGTLYKELSYIDTAKKIIDRVILKTYSN
ncbi:hypothetical protein [Lutibacter maritimus]|uniref:DUF4405 domain-containing protein n=1 Tax=Lutibacter maritimus TaxID=593133 RepID=A0A1I6RY22_9FLAO|nr:hypothetical protein [Lutibacter maritimus]SFS69599.1 hypothetical protein SAMN04488006_2641 [Lutibacter maritimus]